MKRFLECLGVLVICGAAYAAVKISELPESTAPSDNTYIEIADMDQATKSRKLLLTNLVKAAGSPVVNITQLNVTNITQIGGSTYISNVYQQFDYVTNVFTNVVQIFNAVTNYYTNVTWNITGNGNKITITNTVFTVNGTNVATINPTDSYIPYRAGSNFFGDSTLIQADGITKSEANIGAVLTVGDTTSINLLKASQTNAIGAALTFAHATNGLNGVDLTHVRWFFNNSGSDRTITIPSGWKTNVNTSWTADRQITCTNATITVIYAKCGGPTSSSTLQTNVYFSAEHYK